MVGVVAKQQPSPPIPPSVTTIAVTATSTNIASMKGPSTKPAAGNAAFTPTVATTSSNAPKSSSTSSSAETFSSIDYDHIEKAPVHTISKCFPSIGNDFSIIVLLCLYLQALRMHFMTKKFFETRTMYRR